ncbi:MAG: hypothetical protein A2139_01205 [Desulfobacca sp. RBG_16_60_12]|nr:MAG: hypothetical protein A2139_01205 [Desulfobacca sp. RBG_16_60_12]
MPRYKLKKKCLFVDAINFDDPKAPKRYPEVIPYPHILDKSTASYLKLNDTAGFIARFIVIGIDTDLIPQILLSEYGVTLPRLVEGTKAKAEAAAKAAVKSVVRMLRPYLKPRTRTDSKQPYEPPAALGVGKHECKYKLDFSVHFVGTTVVKIPPPPPPPKLP